MKKRGKEAKRSKGEKGFSCQCFFFLFALSPFSLFPRSGSGYKIAKASDYSGRLDHLARS
jgi:hypothetical protein